ncbi:hsp70 nucleotide exchange factor FES1 [Olea europaea var. sylvestris]|uniref:hsp70 nucleotide exchange factor FES1 n=1 Tax=Olea europaea var. sylvestris TaxID=158386 RepID=UPI000C1CD982|nr:hsp70 nucleotide exchange factor FES1 [Olea europaea var. sylvestris]
MRQSISIISLSLIILLAMSFASTERVNKSEASTGLFWSTAKEEGDLLRKAQTDDDSSSLLLGDNQEEHQLDGGFSSLEGMLQWAIGHSDPAKLKEAAADVQRLSPEELKARQMGIKELMEKLKMPSDAQLMKTAIDDLNNSSLSLEDRHRALEELLILVEPVDNANDLHKLGGLTAVIGELDHPDPEIRTISAWVLGKASQNNPVVQKQILELGPLTKLMEMVNSTFTEEAIKALYALSALIINNPEGQESFYREAGHLMLQNILSNSSTDIRLRRKSVFLVADLVENQLGSSNKAVLPFFSNQLFLKSVVDLIASPDLDLQEKALYAVKSLLQLRSTEALVFKEVCKLDVTLETMRQQLQQLMVDENFKEYAVDVESLRREVELIFLGKLDKVDTQVPT